jgi:orotidine-5'-phosphate decarboxylase
VSPGPRVIVALDFPDAKSALALVDRLDPGKCRLKVGKELFTASGPALIETLVRRDFAVFLDLKYHDIPSTVGGACRAAAALGVWMVNVHALGGRAMLQAGHDALVAARPRPMLTAVTMLTSMSVTDLDELGIAGTPEQVVLRLARLAVACGLDGVVCSPREAPGLRRECGANFCLVAPGIRPAQSGPDDQQRIATPRAALENGVDYLVIGRPITRAPDPVAALAGINRDIGLE